MTLLSVGAAAAALIAFALTQTISGDMTFADKWSPLFAALAIIGVLAAIFTPKKQG
jgi:hypothetical protein